MILVIVLRIGELQLLPLRARARALHARVETTLKNRRFQPWANGRRQREDGRGLGVPGGGAALAKIIC